MLKTSVSKYIKFHLLGDTMPSQSLVITAVSSPLAAVFAISRGSKNSAETVQIVLNRGDSSGRGECVPYARYGETSASVIAEIEAIRPQLEAGIGREDLQSLLPAGAARCAVDCALWDLDAKLSGQPVWKLAGLPAPKRLETAVTISMDTPEAMVASARARSGKLLKLKLGGPHDLSRVEAVHAARPDARLILDGNEGLGVDDLPVLSKAAAQLGVIMIEQPLPAGQDQALVSRPKSVAICADESAHTSADIPALASLYDTVNVKLDKTGGLTEAIKMVQAARAANMGVMIGCMVAGSLSMAPAVVLAGVADAADVDGPLWLSQDVPNGLQFSDGYVDPPTPVLWG